MAAPNEPDEPARSTSVHDENEVPVIRLRLVPWDVITTVVLLCVLLALVTMTNWPEHLFAFADTVCQGDDCPQVPFGLNYYILPVMWGGIGAAMVSAVFGPFVSLLRGWFMCFWPIVSVTALSLASVVGRALTDFTEAYSHLT